MSDFPTPGAPVMSKGKRAGIIAANKSANCLGVTLIGNTSVFHIELV
jgi:hypothetical protein